MTDPTAPDADDIEVIHMTAAEWDTALAASLADLGLTWEQLTEQAKTQDFSSLKAQQLWLMAGHRGFSGADPTAPVTADDLRDRIAYAMAHEPPTVYMACNDDMYRELADVALAVRDEELERLRAELADRDSLLEKYRETVGVIVGQREDAKAKRDALKAAMERAREALTDALSGWEREREYYRERAERKGYSHDEMAAEVYGAAIKAVTGILAALAAPESNEDAPAVEEDERG